jgi:FtsP/CotA-like multicopper oxidase with cupredoxin domain
MITRRTLLGAGSLAGLGALAGCSSAALSSSGVAASGAAAASPAAAMAQAIAAAEKKRARSGASKTAALKLQRSAVDLGGRTVQALTYGGRLPGATLRVGAGDLLTVNVQNALEQSTSVHWHGLALRNDMDGVPELTTPEIAAGATASYQFVVPNPGTYWFHPHTGLQLDWGLYAPLIVDDPHEPGRYDDEWVVVLDDWTVGLGETPEDLLKGLLAGGGSMGGMPGMGTMSGTDGAAGMGGMGDMPGMDSGSMGSGSMGSGDNGDIQYPAYLANGRLPEAPDTLRVARGRRVRIRLINAAADTIFDVALTGHKLTVSHSDGFAVTPVTVDTVRIAMGERYDMIITMDAGTHALVAAPVGKPGTAARALIGDGTGTAPSASLRPRELAGRRLVLKDLSAGAAVRRPERTPDTEQTVRLAGSMTDYRWTINGTDFEHTKGLTVRSGQLTRLRMINATMMAHPMHLHGHTFTVVTPGRPRKDTVVVPAMSSVSIDVEADNPGNWAYHCHNAFHMAAGMMTRLTYQPQTPS